MSLRKLTDFVGSKNIAELIPRDKLMMMGARVRRQFDEDLQSMDSWIDTVQKGIDLMKQEFESRSTPWEGASNFKSPILSESSINFGDKAKLELLRSRNLVKSDIIGRDNGGTKKQRAERVTEAMNYQVNYQIEDWRLDQEHLYYVLPNVGTMFKKTDFNPLEMTNESTVIQYPDFAVNQATRSMKKCRSFTHILSFNANEVYERQNSGLWLDESEVNLFPQASEGDEGSNERAMVNDSSDNPDRFLEQQCFFDLDDDGYEEPYIVTIHEASSQVVRVVARFDEQSFIVRNRSGRILNLRKAIMQEAQLQVQRGEQPPESPQLGNYELIRIDPLQNITKYGFLPTPDGTFLDLGYAHLLGAITQAINTTTNQLVDAATLANSGGGLMAKGLKKKMGDLKMRIGEWLSTDLSVEQIRNGLMPNPSPEPSQTLFALNEKLESQGRSFAAVVDQSGAIQANTAPTTALAIIQENLIPTSALLTRILDSTSREFRVMFRLNQRFFDPEIYKMILDDPEANAFGDFNAEDMDIKTTANPEMSSKLQRIQMASVELEQFDRVVAVGGNAKAILLNFFDAIGTDNVDEIFPDPSTMTEQQKQEIENLQKQQQLIAEQQEQQIELTRAQVEIAQGDLRRLNRKTDAEVEKIVAEVEQILAEASKRESEAVLNLEKAETEQVNNQINTYSSAISLINDNSDRIRNAINEAISNRS